MANLKDFNNSYYIIKSIEVVQEFKGNYSGVINDNLTLNEYISGCNYDFINSYGLDAKPLYSVKRLTDNEEIATNLSYDELNEFIENL